jgi:signal transduction histidine kinase
VRLADFIIANIEPIVGDWVAFARTRLPASRDMNDLALRNDAPQILAEIADDMGRPQDDRQRLAKSRGFAVRDAALAESPFRSHATQRARSGFEMIQLVSEYRALRATVLRMWNASARDVDVRDLEDVSRFNEAVDAALAESVQFFMVDVDHARHLFLGVLGHDLRTPLSTIINCARFQMSEGPDVHGVARTVLRSAAHMKSLLDDLLAYTRTHLGRGMTIERAPAALDVVARETVDEINAASPGCNIRLVTTGNLQGAWDARRLHQLLSNLVVNALKYGTPNAPIEVTLDGTLETVVFSVRNFGTPIPAELLPGLFEPLVRGSATDLAGQATQGSMGLGLYIAREIVAAHSGAISVTSTHEDGTRFEIVLPRHTG